jgi:hypothetical protein
VDQINHARFERPENHKPYSHERAKREETNAKADLLFDVALLRTTFIKPLEGVYPQK